MNSVINLYQMAERKHIPVLAFCLPENGSLCFCDENDHCFIGIDEQILKTEREKKVHLAHELGHCLTGSFYNRYTSLDLRQKHENQADKWAIEAIIPRQSLTDALAAGYRELWSLAEFFGVTEEFMRKAVCYHQHGHLAPDAAP